MLAMLRPKAAWNLFAVGKTQFNDHYVARPGGPPLIEGTGVPRVKPIRIGKRAMAFASDEITATIEALKRERDAAFEAGLESPSQIQARRASEAAAKKRAEGGRRKRRGQPKSGAATTAS